MSITTQPQVVAEPTPETPSPVAPPRKRRWYRPTSVIGRGPWANKGTAATTIADIRKALIKRSYG